MQDHKYIQPGTLSLVLLVPVFLLIVIMLFTIARNDLIQSLVLVFVAVILLISLLIFYKMTINVNDTHVIVRMGIGLITKEFELSQIKGCKPVRNSPIDGVGIRKIPGGWLYNVTGLKAIELSFKNKKSVVRIGTDKPEEISVLINKLTDDSNQESLYDEKDFTGYFLTGILLLSVIILPAVLIICGNRETVLTAGEESVRVTGMYGVTINYTDIISLDTIQHLPSVKSKRFGYAFEKTMKGNFTLTNGEPVKLYVRRVIPPYINIKTGEMNLYINNNNPDSTRMLFQRINKNRSLKTNIPVN